MDGLQHRLQIGKRFAERVAGRDAFFLGGMPALKNLPYTEVRGEARLLSGMNRFMLLQVMKDKGWLDPRFFTAAQARDAGWSITSSAKPITLQYLVATDAQGATAEKPEVLKFNVFNAQDIAGVPAISPGAVDLVTQLGIAATQAGFEAGPKSVRAATVAWLSAMQGELMSQDPAAASLRTRLAISLIEVQTGLPGEAVVNSQVADHWANEIASAPLKFFECVRDAERLAASVMLQVSLIVNEQQASAELKQARLPSLGHKLAASEGEGMETKSAVSTQMEALFAQRTAVLAVPFAEKDRARNAGAMWYAPLQVWFVPDGVDLKRFQEWSPTEHALGATASKDVIVDEFIKAMSSLGLNANGKIEADGAWHNVSVDTKKGKNKSGSYILSMNASGTGQPTGFISNKHTGEQLSWVYDGPLLTPEARAKLRGETQRRAAEAERQEQVIRDAAAKHAKEIFISGTSAEKHGYVLKKSMPTEGLRVVTGAVLLRYDEFKGEGGKSIIRAAENYLIVPMTTEAGEIRAVQVINESGSMKTFMRGGQKRGLMFVLGASSFDALVGMKPPVIAYCEGLATGASFRQSTGAPMVVTFDAGNLEVDAAQTAHKVPLGVTPVIAVDNDQFHVERALGFLVEQLGVNPHSESGSCVEVAAGPKSARLVPLGEAVADGEWHQAPQGKYKIGLELEEGSTEVKALTVEIAPTNGRKITSRFGNRGIEAGQVALKAFGVDGGGSRAVMVVPEFKSLENRPTDWNDLVQREGPWAVRNLLKDVPGLQGPVQQRGQNVGTKSAVGRAVGLER